MKDSGRMQNVPNERVIAVLLHDSRFGSTFLSQQMDIQGGYHDKIPEQEHSLHANVSKGPQVDFLNKWQKQLPEKVIMVYEYLNGDLLKEKGYEPLHQRGELVRLPGMWATLCWQYCKLIKRKIVLKLSRLWNGSASQKKDRNG